jgi:hypothetical protein
LKAFGMNRQDQLDQIRSERQDALSAGPEVWLLLQGQGEQGEHWIEIGPAGESCQIHPGNVLLEESPQQAWLAGAVGDAPVGQKHQHPQMRHVFTLLQQAEGFRGKAAVEAPIGMHLHLQDHHRQGFAAAG